ncbi:unnamed protein product [Heligmosomoides polygyrus]|uniref:Galactosylgalactosylxylosylprotein 3-beta-glucuronosyltransferase n=1 Tax=Heligmosomoides polygyrus TaxID=6339 RepID=A0A183F863_HELPZ|nr:unnamed protein product [Heligmosomoides polygyrus]
MVLDSPHGTLHPVKIPPPKLTVTLEALLVRLRVSFIILRPLETLVIIIFVSGTVISFNAVWKPEREFPIDMAAFAVNITLVTSRRGAAFSYDVARGYQESHFLAGLGLSRRDFEPKADNCSKVFVWHTRTEKSKFSKLDWERIAAKEREQFDNVEAHALGL